MKTNLSCQVEITTMMRCKEYARGHRITLGAVVREALAEFFNRRKVRRKLRSIISYTGRTNTAGTL